MDDRPDKTYLLRISNTDNLRILAVPIGGVCEMADGEIQGTIVVYYKGKHYQTKARDYIEISKEEFEKKKLMNVLK